MMEDPLYNFKKKFTNIKDTQPGFLSFDKFLWDAFLYNCTVSGMIMATCD